MLRDAEAYALPMECDCYAFALRTDSETIKSIIQDFGLFTESDGIFYSESLKRRMSKYDEKRAKARASANARWRKNANAMRTHSGRNANAMQVKESRVNKSILNKRKNIKKKENPPDFIPYDLWIDFLAHRKALKKPMTEKAKQLFFSKLEKLKKTGEDPVELIETAIERGWQTVYPPKKEKKAQPKENYVSAPPGWKPEGVKYDA